MNLNWYLLRVILPFCLCHNAYAMQRLSSSIDDTTAEDKAKVSTTKKKEGARLNKLIQTSPRSIEASDAKEKTVAKVPPTKNYPRAHFDFTTAQDLKEPNIEKTLKDLILQEEKGVWGALYCCDDEAFIKTWAHQARAKKLKGCLLLNKKISDNAEEVASYQAKEKAEDDRLSKLFDKCNIARRRVEAIEGKRFTQMHNKILLFECNESKKTLLVTGSANVSKWALATRKDSGHFEDIVILDDPAIIAHYITELVYMFEHSSEAPGSFASAESLEHLKTFQKSIPIALEIGTDKFPTVRFRDRIRELVTNLISWEKEAILGAQFQVHCEKAIRALETNQNIRRIALIIDPANIDRLDLFEALSKVRQLQLFVINRPLFRLGNGNPSDLNANTHHKFLVFKSNIHGKRVMLVGSANLSAQSLDNNWENAIAVDNEGLIKQFTQAFISMKKLAREVTKEIATAVKKKQIPNMFIDTSDE